MKKTVSRILSLFVFVLSVSVFSQQHQRVQSIKTPVPGEDLFTTPEVKAFQSYNFLKPDLYTGRLNVEIPIFEIKSGGCVLNWCFYLGGNV